MKMKKYKEGVVCFERLMKNIANPGSITESTVDFKPTCQGSTPCRDIFYSQVV